MKVVVTIGYDRKESFCYNGIVNTILETLNDNDIEYTFIDLYEDGFHPSGRGNIPELIEQYQKVLCEATHHFFISPVYWGRCTSMLEGMFDLVMTTNVAYRFKHLFGVYGMPIPLWKDKRMVTWLTHGGPASVIYTLYVNAIALRLDLGFATFIYGWFRSSIIQFFSVPFVTDEKRKKMLDKTRKRVEYEIRRYHKKTK